MSSDILLTAIAPISWSTTYAVATEFLSSGHPLLVASLRSLPIGLLSNATLIGYLFLQETFTTIQLAGIAIVLASVVIGQQTSAA